MGDEAELYWKMEHDPFFWDEVERYNSYLNNSSNGVKKKQKPKKKNNNNQPREKKKNMSLFIDGENISHTKVKKIMKAAEKEGELFSARVYGLQKDPHTKAWTDEAKEYGIKDIRLSGGPEKDKADKKIQKDTNREIVNAKNVDIVCIATSDKGFTDTVRDLREKGKKVVIIGEGKTPQELRDACSKFIEV